MNTQLLVIGYGNELRGDDAVGPRVARTVATWQLPGLEAVAVHQLTPELVELIAAAERVLFVDADRDRDGIVLIRPLEPSRVAPWLGHVVGPRELLALAEALHGRSPEVWLLTVPATELSFREELSPAAQRGLEAALRQIRRMTDDFSSMTE